MMNVMYTLIQVSLDEYMINLSTPLVDLDEN